MYWRLRFVAQWKRAIPPLLLAAALGCGQEEPAAPQAKQQPTQQAQPQQPSQQPVATPNPTPENPTPQVTPQMTELAFLHQPFEAAIQTSLPMGLRRPPDETATGKSIGKLFEEVKRQWPEIRFVSAANTALKYEATVETDQGTIVIELRPDIAPNHVRAFAALAKVGYYDGMYFETRFGTRDSEEQPRAIAGASPEADGRDVGSIGFWLRPEILLPDKAQERGIRHEAGTVFTSLMGCRFYIGLNSAPIWDGEYVTFGKVTSGLEAANRLFDQLGRALPAGMQPPNPPMIRKVTISVNDTGKPWPKLGE
jgi:peptidyl-prolyl cis-trans isomerase B (cyclophilin B)